MIKTLKELYNIDVISIIKKTDKTFIINSKNEDYIFKYVPNNNENIYLRLALYQTSFHLPIKNRYNHYVSKLNDKYFILQSMLSKEEILTKDLKLSFYFKSIAYLHSLTTYPLKINDSYLLESLSYIEREVEKAQDEILTRIEVVEKEDYHSPASYFFLNNYIHYYNAYKESLKHLDKIDDLKKDISNINLSLTYQNFSLDHIYPKDNKIVSLEKIAYAPSIYDLYDVINNIDINNISLIPYIKDYLNINPLKEIEIHWLLSLLFVLPLKRKQDEIDDLNSQMNTIKYLKKVEEIASFLLNFEKEE